MNELRPSTPVRPLRPNAELSRPERGSLLPVLVVLGFALGAALVIISCAGVAGVLVVLAIGAGIAFIGLQYLLWGWWLTKKLRDEQGDDPAG